VWHFLFTNNIMVEDRKKNKINKHIIGIITYIVIFVIGIPIILYKYSYFTLLEGYLPNIDLLANVLSWYGGPFNIWEDLYSPNQLSVYRFMSSSIINYIALLGLTYIVAREVKLTGNIIKGWSIGFVMLLMTYLLPSKLVTQLMNKINDMYNSKTFATIGGLIVSAFIIIFESFILKNSRQTLLKTGKSIINFPKLF